MSNKDAQRRVRKQEMRCGRCIQANDWSIQALLNPDGRLELFVDSRNLKTAVIAEEIPIRAHKTWAVRLTQISQKELNERKIQELREYQSKQNKTSD